MCQPEKKVKIEEDQSSLSMINHSTEVSSHNDDIHSMKSQNSPSMFDIHQTNQLNASVISHSSPSMSNGSHFEDKLEQNHLSQNLFNSGIMFQQNRQLVNSTKKTSESPKLQRASIIPLEKLDGENINGMKSPQNGDSVNKKRNRKELKDLDNEEEDAPESEETKKKIDEEKKKGENEIKHLILQYNSLISDKKKQKKVKRKESTQQKTRLRKLVDHEKYFEDNLKPINSNKNFELDKINELSSVTTETCHEETTY
jgi:hypothetical protein